MTIVVTAESDNAATWLQDVVRELLSSDSWLALARGLTLAGLTSDDSNHGLLHNYAEDDTSPFHDVARNALEMRHRDIWARHWFEQFLNADNDDHAWAGLRLLLRGVDRCVALWNREFEDAALRAC